MSSTMTLPRISVEIPAAPYPGTCAEVCAAEIKVARRAATAGYPWILVDAVGCVVGSYPTANGAAHALASFRWERGPVVNEWHVGHVDQSYDER